MKQTYSISGMSCNGCKSFVQQSLEKVAGVKKVDVNLEQKNATIESENPIPFEQLEGALEGSHYHISQEEVAPVKKN